MNLLKFNTLFTCNETNSFGFKGETFFVSGKAIDFETKTEKWIIHNTAFNGMCLGGGLTTNLVSDEELESHYTVKSETFEEMEKRISEEYHNPPAVEEKEKEEEFFFTEEQMEKIRTGFAEFRANQKPEFAPEVELCLWRTELIPKENDSILKKDQTFLISAFAKNSDSEELSYVLTEVAKVDIEGLPVSYEPVGLVVSMPTKEVLLDKFHVHQV